MTGDRLDACGEQLEHIAAASLEQQADVLEFVHRSLVAELDDLLAVDRGA